ncbi:MAG: ribosome small subunit-dependent GTPase A [Eubacterium sp.]|nr:ribosome small subunit-dependent GTPase A [Eubacterium sp.]
MIGRIIRGVGGLYYVAANNSIYECSARGRFRKAKITPTVGDFVTFTVLDEANKKGALDTIEKRKNSLIRPRVANIDTAVITFAAASPDINRDLLDRFLILAETQHIPNIVICINKSDLVDNKAIEDFKAIYEPLYSVVFVSAKVNKGIEDLRNLIKGVTVFAGPSGVGKSSLINSLVPESNRQTGEISKKIERGKHTTRQVELLNMDNDNYIVDSPGFTSLSLDFMDYTELQHYFREFEPYLGQCRFIDCAHIAEPDCAVKAHIGEEISQERYDRFLYLYNELKKR